MEKMVDVANWPLGVTKGQGEVNEERERWILTAKRRVVAARFQFYDNTTIMITMQCGKEKTCGDLEFGSPTKLIK